MNKETIAATDFQRKPYAMPQMKLVKINQADIICTSPSAQNEEYEDGNTEGWF